jgi:hypothetical protein
MVACFEPGSAAELAEFARLQAQLPPLIQRVFGDRQAPRTVVVVPSLSLDEESLARIPGALHYEERQLSMLLLLRMPNTRLVYVTSLPLHPLVVDYYLNMMQGVPTTHARARLELLSACDGTPGALSAKLLGRPRLLARLRAAIGDPALAHLSVFSSSPLERTLAVRLGIPLYSCDPALMSLGSKSGGRQLFREAGIEMPAGAECLRDRTDVVEALAGLRRRNTGLSRAVLKLDEGFSGGGNAVFDYAGAPDGAGLEAWIDRELPGRLRFEAPGESFEHYLGRFAAMRGVVEAWIDGDDKRSPSAQLRIDPLGGIEPISTHDQVLGGPSGQVFQGSLFPADPAYRKAIQAAGLAVAERLRDRGVIGRVGVDFVVTRAPGGWRSFAIEINLRKGGTTHPFQMLQYLSDGRYCADDGEFRTRAGEPRCYCATDNLSRDCYRRLTPDDVIEVVVQEGLHFDPATQCGVAFSLLGCVSEHGKLGLTAIAATQAAARARCAGAVAALDRAAGCDGADPTAAPPQR